MSAENKALVNRWIGARNTHNVEAAVALFPDDWHNTLRGSFNATTLAFPDVKITVNEMIAEGNKVVLHWTFTGTHCGEFQGALATGKAVCWLGIDIYTIIDGKIVGLTRVGDMLRLLQQIGAISPTGQQTVKLTAPPTDV